MKLVLSERGSFGVVYVDRVDEISSMESVMLQAQGGIARWRSRCGR